MVGRGVCAVGSVMQIKLFVSIVLPSQLLSDGIIHREDSPGLHGVSLYCRVSSITQNVRTPFHVPFKPADSFFHAPLAFSSETVPV